MLLASHTALCRAGVISSFYSAVGLASLFIHTSANRELGTLFCNRLQFAYASWPHRQGENITGCPFHWEAELCLLFLYNAGLVEAAWQQQRAGSLSLPCLPKRHLCISSQLDVGRIEVEGSWGESISITNIYYLVPMETLVLQGDLILTFFLSMENLLL